MNKCVGYIENTPPALGPSHYLKKLSTKGKITVLVGFGPGKVVSVRVRVRAPLGPLAAESPGGRMRSSFTAGPTPAPVRRKPRAGFRGAER